MTHTTTVTDATDRTRPGGYGTFGHGVWRITCTCGWSSSSDLFGKSQADMIARDHAGHRNGQHDTRRHGCEDCERSRYS